MNKIASFLKRKKSSIMHLLGSFMLLLLSAFIGIMLGLNKANAVDKYVDEAVEYFNDNNWTAFYNYAEVIDNDFINEVSFNDMAENMYGEISEDDIVIEEITEEDDEAKVSIVYKTKDGETHKSTLVFQEKDEKTYIFFPKWKLDIDEMIIEDSTFTVPSGFTVYVDGIEITLDNANIEKDEVAGNDTYVIPRLFKGKHVVYVQKDGLEVVEAEVSWTENNSSYVLDVEELQLAQDKAEEIKQSSQDIVVGMYSAIFSESGIDNVSSYFKQDEATISMLTSVYDNMLAAIKPEDGSTLNSMEFTSFNYDVFDYSYPYEADVTISFECTFSARGKRNSKGGVREKYEGTSSSSVTLHFIKEGENWYCNTLNMTCIDYSKKEEATE